MGNLNDLSPNNTIADPITGDEANVIKENGVFKLQVKSTAAPQPIGDLFFIHATNINSTDMNVDGSTTPVDFIIDADLTKDLIVSSLLFEAFDGGIKIDKFLGENSSLTNGILIEVKSQNEIFQFLSIKDTQEFDSHFAFGQGRSYSLIFASGNDSMVARFGLENPFIIKKFGTYPNNEDYIKISVRDNLSSVSKLQFIAEGGKE